MKLLPSTERLARYSARRPWLVIGVWALLIIVSGIIVSALLQEVLTTEYTFINNPESDRGQDLLRNKLRGPVKVHDILIVSSSNLKVDDKAFQNFVQTIHGEIAALGEGVVESSVDYYQTRNESLVSADRKATIIPIVLVGTIDEARANVEKLREISTSVSSTDGFQVFLTGEASISEDFQKLSEKDLNRGEIFGVPITLAILVLVFGALAAAFVPLLIAAFSIVLALGATALIGQGFHFSFFVVNMITMMGLAVGIDYSLFIISRYREERARGLEKIEAIGRAGSTASKAVFFSGMTVVLALLGMLIIPTSVFVSLGAGAILVVAFAVLASLTLLPAMLSILGDRINSLRIPFIQRAQARLDEGRSEGFWDRLAKVVMGYPVISLCLAVGILVAAVIPAFKMQTGFSGVESFPENVESKQGFLLLQKDFSFNLVSPAEVVVSGNIDSAAVQEGIERFKSALKSDPSFGQVETTVNPQRDLALLSIPMVGDAYETAPDLARKLRSQYVTAAFAGSGAEVLVTGLAAGNVDFFDLVAKYAPIVFIVVLGLSFMLLMVVFRSIVVPVKAILMNLLSVGAAYGILVLVFQEGYGADVLHFQQVKSIEAWLPIFLFAVLFGLSMDYHVFLLSRIRERFDLTQQNAEAVAFGIRSTGRIITGAALIMVSVFSAFASGEMSFLQQTGFGLAVAIFLDATIVRSVLVPASMRLLGRINWYLPKTLSWLPDVRIEAK